jgi:hypothetical protein
MEKFMSNAADVAETFIQSIAAGEFEAARQGPFDTFSSAEPSTGLDLGAAEREADASGSGPCTP